MERVFMQTDDNPWDGSLSKPADEEFPGEILRLEGVLKQTCYLPGIAPAFWFSTPRLPAVKTEGFRKTNVIPETMTFPA